VQKSPKFIWTDDREHMVMMGIVGETNSNFTCGTPTNSTTFLFDHNDIAPISQRGASGGTLALPFYDSLNNLRVGEAPAHGIHLRSDVGLNSSGPNPIARMWIQSDAVGKVGLLLTPTFAGPQTAPLLVLRNAAGYDTFRVMADGTFYITDGTTLRAVSVGQPNSCGSARCLTVAN